MIRAVEKKKKKSKLFVNEENIVAKCGKMCYNNLTSVKMQDQSKTHTASCDNGSRSLRVVS